MRLTGGQKAEILARADKGEQWSSIARAMGLKPVAVGRHLRRNGRVPQTLKIKIAALHREDPTLTTRDIVARLGCSRDRVRAIARICGIGIPPSPRIHVRARPQVGIVALGRAARAAGLTVAEIAALAARRNEGAQQ